MPAECLLYPAHDYRGIPCTSVSEERRFNPRIGGNLSEGDFVGYMSNLGLPHPKQIDVAVPANLACGKPSVTAPTQADPTWAPLAFTFAGFWEIQPHWVEEHLHEVQVVDVRESDEFDGPLGHIRGALSVPLGKLGAEAGSIPKERPIVTVCRAGGRSAQAINILQKAGFHEVANLAGGMLRWRADGLSVEGGRQ